MKNKLYLYHHLGLGDHIICNSLVRHYSKLYTNIYLFVKEHNFQSVSFMYRDLDNIQYIIGDDEIAIKVINHDLSLYKDKIKIVDNIGNLSYFIPDSGFFYDGRAEEEDVIIITNDDNSKKFDECFYKGFDFSKRWTDFYVKRDPEREIRLFEKYNVKENEYVFIHDDKDRGFNINLNGIRPVIGLTDNIFDYLYLIENANEIHCIDSCFKLMIDSMEIDNKLFHYKNRNLPNELYSSSKLNWIVK